MAYITNRVGNPTQFVVYMPYGESLTEEHSTSNKSPYKFNGKEQDQETGLYYYSARYYQPKIGLFYGVDPLVEDYPNFGSCVYCYDNPIKYIDPDGKRGTPARGSNNGRFNTARSGRPRSSYYPNGVRPRSTITTTTTSHGGRGPRRDRLGPGYRELIPETPLYMETFTTGGQNSISMSKNNTRAQDIAKLVEFLDLGIQAIYKTVTLYTDHGPRKESSVDIRFSDNYAQALYTRLQNNYEAELSKRISNIEFGEPTFDTSKYFSSGGGGEMQYNMDKDESLKDYTRQLQNIYKEMGPSPKNILLNKLNFNSSKYPTTGKSTESRLIPEIRQAN